MTDHKSSQWPDELFVDAMDPVRIRVPLRFNIIDTRRFTDDQLFTGFISRHGDDGAFIGGAVGVHDAHAVASEFERKVLQHRRHGRRIEIPPVAREVVHLLEPLLHLPDPTRRDPGEVQRLDRRCHRGR